MRAKSWTPKKPSPSASTPPIMRRQSSRLQPSAPRMASMTARSSSAVMRPSPSASNTRKASMRLSSPPGAGGCAAMAATASSSSSEGSPWPRRRSTASSSRRGISAGDSGSTDRCDKLHQTVANRFQVD
ncbi:hypothetical protein PVAP13_6KG053635 [Panicum virgatum]|uniref:Uncharacterized protein n=1 Tax=Panicum virgatum TaxID=38727 RepID=A0A8T0R8Y3_PANVG|nr:hypothetical protein PVAP13_6KG053635 [Panicum virgatum]